MLYEKALEQFETEVMYIVCYYIEKHNSKGILRNQLYGDDRTLDLFPSKQEMMQGNLIYADVEANRFAHVIMDVVADFRTQFDTPALSMGVDPREVFEKFPSVIDIIHYYRDEILRINEAALERFLIQED